jgi:hypothetical protein
MALFGGVAIGAKVEAPTAEPTPQVAEPVGE